jgi:hypothetical protein
MAPLARAAKVKTRIKYLSKMQSAYWLNESIEFVSVYKVAETSESFGFTSSKQLLRKAQESRLYSPSSVCK